MNMGCVKSEIVGLHLHGKERYNNEGVERKVVTRNYWARSNRGRQGMGREGERERERDRQTDRQTLRFIKVLYRIYMAFLFVSIAC